MKSPKELQEAITWGEEYYKSHNHELSYDKWWDYLGLPPRKDGKYRVWGPKNPFEAHIGTRTIYGMTVSSIEYKNSPKLPDYAGCKPPWTKSKTEIIEV